MQRRLRRRKRERERERMSLSDWHLAVKLADQPLAPKSILRLPETELGEYSLGGYSISFLKQLIAGKLQESVPDPELIDLIYCGRKLKDDQTLDFYGIQPGSTVHVLRKSWPEPDQKPEPVDKVAALREFRVLHTALHGSSSYREAVFKMLSNKESLDQIIVATPGLSSDPIALGTSPMSSSVQSGTPITNDLFSQALQHALQASGQPSLQSQWQPQLQQLRDMGIQDDELSLRALQATGGDIQAALELIFAGGAP
ncbi:UBL7 [Cervus elaphus hippelaphus]|uniref:Ubiquitin-like protein 7 n=1 Tax=Cervus elaphus hippelaphus TaxID=46360 RepID=A0A212CSX9_CEREH|nr:UBL7 [Cervus elaphus hippelaphus]